MNNSISKCDYACPNASTNVLLVSVSSWRGTPGIGLCNIQVSPIMRNVMKYNAMSSCSVHQLKLQKSATHWRCVVALIVIYTHKKNQPLKPGYLSNGLDTLVQCCVGDKGIDKVGTGCTNHQSSQKVVNRSSHQEIYHNKKTPLKENMVKITCRGYKLIYMYSFLLWRNSHEKWISTCKWHNHTINW